MNDDDALVSRKESLDVSKIFLSYMASGGDAIATAKLAECALDDVLFLARSEVWDRKMEAIGILRGGSPEDRLSATKGQNRMALFIQAQRLRGIVDLTLKQVYENEENVGQFCQERNKRGEPFFSTKPLRELVDSAEKIHSMLYRALGDFASKDESKGTPGANAVRDLHLTVIQQLQQTGGTVPERELVLAEKRHGTTGPQQASGYLDVDAVLG